MWPQTSFEWIFALIGLLVGCAYAFDGWRGGAATKGLKDSPRIQDLRYALGGLLLTIIADLTKAAALTDAAEPVNKARLAAVYLIWFCWTATVVILALAVVISVSFRRRRQRQPDLWFEGAGPVVHFLVHGYRAYSEALNEAVEEMEQRESARLRAELADYRSFIHAFLPNYNQQVARTVVAINAVRDGDAAMRDTVAKMLLVTVASVVQAFARQQSDLVVSANFMRAVPVERATPAEQGHARFLVDGLSTCSHLLVLEQQSGIGALRPLALPVRTLDAQGKGWQLPGAPTAFALRDTQIVEDTANPPFHADVPAATRDEIKQHFAGCVFKSFAAMTIIQSATVCGVLNIEANKPSAFGTNEMERNQIISLISPFCHLLGFLIRT